MNLAEEVDLEDYVARPDKINNAEIASICQVGGWLGGWVGGGGSTRQRCSAARMRTVALCGRSLLALLSGGAAC